MGAILQFIVHCMRLFFVHNVRLERCIGFEGSEERIKVGVLASGIQLKDLTIRFL